MTRLIALIGATIFCAATLVAQAPDPLTGTWEFNAAQSKFIPASMAPRSQTRTYRVDGNQNIARHTGVDAQGNPTLVEFTVTLDGEKCPLKGYADWDAISMKKIDANTAEFTQYLGGKATFFGRTVVSKDGKTLTVSGKGTAANGDNVDLLAVFDKVKRGASR